MPVPTRRFGRALFFSLLIAVGAGFQAAPDLMLTAAPASAQEPPLPPMTEEQRNAWFLTSEGEHWISQEFREERVACVMMENRVEILATVLEHMLLGQPHEEDPEGLDAIRRALEPEPFEIEVWRGLPLSRFEKHELDDEDAASPTKPLQAALNNRGLDARLAASDAPADPREPGDRARYRISITHPGSMGAWISSTVEVLDLRSGEYDFSGTARVARIGGEWRLVALDRYGLGSVRFIGSDPYERYSCTQ